MKDPKIETKKKATVFASNFAHIDCMIFEIVVKKEKKINYSHTFYMGRDNFCLYFCPYRLYDLPLPYGDIYYYYVIKKKKILNFFFDV